MVEVIILKMIKNGREIILKKIENDRGNLYRKV